MGSGLVLARVNCAGTAGPTAFAVRRLPHPAPQVERQCFSRNRTSAVPMQTTHGKHTVDEPLRVCIGQRTRRVRGPAWKDDRPDRPCEGVRPDRDSELRENVSCPAKLIESGGCCRRILARQGDPWTWDGRVPWGNGSAPLVLLRSAWRCGTSWLRPARRAMQWHAGGPGARRVLVRPTWICSSRPSWDDTSGVYFTAGQGCIQARFVWSFPARILASARWMGRWIERWILLWITLWISD